MNETRREIDLHFILTTLRERKWVILAIFLVTVAATGVYSYFSTPMYRATAKVVRETTNLDEALFGSRIFQTGDESRSLKTAAQVVRTDQVAQMVKEETGSARSISSLINMVRTTPSTDTDIIEISAVSANAEETAVVANSFARQFIAYRQQSDRSTLAVARNQVQMELQSMTSEELASERGRTLSQKYEELGILESLQTGGFSMIHEARTPASPFAPRHVFNAGIGFVGGLVAGLILAFLMQFMDRRVKDEKTVESRFGLPVLARIPGVDKKWGRRNGSIPAGMIGFADPKSPLLEAFRSLRSNLRFFDVDKPIRTILITSALPKEGKSVTTINLALSLALSGAKVLIVEADLRRPRIADYLGVNPGIGLTSQLTRGVTLSNVIQGLACEPYFPPRTPSAGSSSSSAQSTRPATHIAVITSGPLPPNPAELLASSQMESLLSQAHGLADYILVDAPPVLAVSDALVLAPHVDAILVTARLFSTTTESIDAVRSMMERVNAPVLGVVVQDVPRPRSYYRTYGGYVTQN